MITIKNSKDKTICRVKRKKKMVEIKRKGLITQIYFLKNDQVLICHLDQDGNRVSQQIISSAQGLGLRRFLCDGPLGS